MTVRTRLVKVVDVSSVIRCAMGRGILREEVWQNAEGEVVRYNLAFINHLLCSLDNGRVLGYDNRHGTHHRHRCGFVESVSYSDYDVLLEQFLDEVRELRGERR